MIRVAMPPLALASAMVAALIVSRPPPPPAAPTPKAGPGAHATETAGAPKLSAPAPIELPRADPFRPFEERAQPKKAAPAAQTALKFQGVYQRGRKLYASFNGSIYGVGDSLGEEGKVKEIEIHPVRVKFGPENGPDITLTTEEAQK